MQGHTHLFGLRCAEEHSLPFTWQQLDDLVHLLLNSHSPSTQSVQILAILTVKLLQSHAPLFGRHYEKSTGCISRDSNFVIS